MNDIEELKKFSLSSFSLKGNCAIVTGANKGLGFAFAYALAKAGADLFIPFHSGDTEELRSLVEAENRKIHFLQGDLTDTGYIKSVIKQCTDIYGHIDILVNNAGTNYFGDFEDFPDEEYIRVMNTNLNAVYFMSHEASVVMKKQGNGKIINIGSALSYSSDLRCPSYAAAKHGIIGLTKVFANELGEFNIQTNAICPGFIATAVTSGITGNKDFVERISHRTPAGRWGNPTDLMGTVVFLASHASDYVNGSDIRVDGGFYTRLV